MTVALLHYDILSNIIPFLPPMTLIEYATTCRQLCQPALRQLWNSPIVITTPKSFKLLIQSLLNAILIPNNSTTITTLPRLDYHRWITKLTITFETFQPISIYLLQLIVFNKLTNLSFLSLHNTYAIFSTNIHYLHLNDCIIKNLPNNINNDQQQQNNILSNMQPILNNQDMSIIESSSSSFILSNMQKTNFNDPSSSSSPFILPLTHLSIINCTISIETNHQYNNNDDNNNNRETTTQLSDDHLYLIANSCPKLRQCQMNGFFSDEGIIHLANHCKQLEEVYFTLPTNLVQSNTITQKAIHELATQCPKLRRFSCLGQTRINPILAKETFHLYCPSFIHCDF